MSKLEQAARQALEALETDEQWGFVSVKVLERRLPAITALREALAEQAEQERVWYARKDQLQKCVRSTGLCEISPEPRQDRIPVYAAPVRTKDLTDDELADACGWKLGDPMYEWVVDIGRWAIAADREKNK